MVMPKNVGLPLGEEDSLYFIMEIHYDNPEQAANVIDNSGWNVYYTSNLREHDAFSQDVQAFPSPNTVIPPRQEEFIVTGHCDPFCLQEVCQTYFYMHI